MKRDGSVWSWGSNGYGQLGDGTTFNRSTPVRVVGLTDVTAVSAGSFHSLALDLSGAVWSWGYNFGLGSQGMAHFKLPEQLVLLDCLPVIGDKTDRRALAALASSKSKNGGSGVKVVSMQE